MMRMSWDEEEWWSVVVVEEGEARKPLLAWEREMVTYSTMLKEEGCVRRKHASHVITISITANKPFLTPKPPNTFLYFFSKLYASINYFLDI